MAVTFSDAGTQLNASETGATNPHVVTYNFSTQSLTFSAGDVLVLVMLSYVDDGFDNGQTPNTYSTPSGWTKQVQQICDTPSNEAYTYLVYTTVADGTETDVTVNITRSTGTHDSYALVAGASYSGGTVGTVGTPATDSAVTSFSVPGITLTEAGRALVVATAESGSFNANFSAAGVTERFDLNYSAAEELGIWLGDFSATAGATGNKSVSTGSTIDECGGNMLSIEESAAAFSQALIFA